MMYTLPMCAHVDKHRLRAFLMTLCEESNTSFLSPLFFFFYSIIIPRISSSRNKKYHPSPHTLSLYPSCHNNNTHNVLNVLKYIEEELPPENPPLFGLHSNAEINPGDNDIHCCCHFFDHCFTHQHLLYPRKR
jgi:hypothetical protein